LKKSRLKKSDKEVSVSKIPKTKIDHLNRQIPPVAHTPMYLWHKYWSRKTWNVVGEFIKAYCPEGGIVFDPFAGSGITAMEALKNGRKAIVCDLNPIATEIIRLTIKPVKEIELYEAFERVEKKVRKAINSLYLTQCRDCGEEFPFTCSIWENNKCVEIRYESCPKCGNTCRSSCELTQKDKLLLKKIEATKIKEWYPNNKLYYPDGMPFKEKQQYNSVDELFTRRNLQALAWLMEAIEEEPKKDLRDFLRIGFSSMSHLCSRLLAEGSPGYRPFSGVGWNQQSYWFTPRYMESNVWEKFVSATKGHQGLIKAKAESNKYFKDIKIASSFDQVVSGNAFITVLVLT